MKILVVDDEDVIVKGIKFNLQNDGYEVVTGSDGRQAVALAHDPEVKLIVLDVMMPEIDGLEACRRIREFSDVPIIMLTARTQDMDKRMGALETQRSRITVGELTVDTQERNVYKNGVVADLTAREFDMVELLIRNPNRVYSRENLLDLIWGYDAYRSDIRTVDVHIRRIREKLETVPAEPVYFMTKWGVGYYFKA